MTRVLVTGAFGRLGQVVLRELKARDLHVTAMAREKPANRRTARRMREFVDDVVWGDVRHADLRPLVDRRRHRTWRSRSTWAAPCA